MMNIYEESTLNFWICVDATFIDMTVYPGLYCLSVTGDNRMVVTEVTTIPTWWAQKQVRSFFLIFSVHVHEKLLSCPLDKNVFNDPL